MAKLAVRTSRGAERSSQRRPIQHHVPPGHGRTIPQAKQIPTRKRLYILDTNVLMHDPSCLSRFEEHDIFIPAIVVQELDHNKNGHDEKNRNTRETLRIILKLIEDNPGEVKTGLPLKSISGGRSTGKLFLQTLPLGTLLDTNRADNQILLVVAEQVKTESHRRNIVLVTKDVNMRIKAHSAGIIVEDYISDQVVEDVDILYTGVYDAPSDIWKTHQTEVKKVGQHDHYVLTGQISKNLHVNQFVLLPSNGGNVEHFQTKVVKTSKNSAVLTTLTNYAIKKHNVFGVEARNKFQNYALNLLMDPEIDFVTLLGIAGTGKTLMALAAGLEQVLEKKIYTEIVVTRATVPIGEDIGYLPGTEEEKMTPWMGAFEDNIDVLINDANANEWGKAATRELIRSKIKIKSLSFMRGRTFINKFLIIDEAQNLTPKQMKALITRAGPGTKVICLGNLAQIDTPYLSEGSSGLTYVVDRFKGWGHSGHITLKTGERSRLASHANEVL